MQSLDFVLQVVGTLFFIAAGFNKHIPGTNSMGLGAALWGVSFLI